VLDSNIEDDDSNFTRFLLLSRQSIRYWATLSKHACVCLDTLLTLPCIVLCLEGASKLWTGPEP
jgi:prephenate dehydratase